MRHRISLTREQSAKLIVVISLAAVAYEGYAIAQLVAARDWPAAEGTIVESRRETRGFGSRRTTSTRVRYRYHVAGKAYEGRCVQFGALHELGSGMDWNFRGFPSRYPKGTKVAVYYNPQQPTRAVIERQLPLGGYLVLTAAMVGVVYGLLRLRGEVYEAPPRQAAATTASLPR